jgi:chromosome segregation ATPase
MGFLLPNHLYLLRKQGGFMVNNKSVLSTDPRAHSEENKATYVHALHRQIIESDKKVKEIQKNIKDRGADANPQIKKRLEQLELKWEEVHEKFESLETKTEEWPHGSLSVSTAFKELEDLILLLRTKVKPL